MLSGDCPTIFRQFLRLLAWSSPVLVGLSAFVAPASAAPCWLASPRTVFIPPDGDSTLAHDGLADTAWASSDFAEADCENQPQYADPQVKLEAKPHRPLILEAVGALTEASARTEGISEVGREVRTRLYYQLVNSDVWQVLREWRQQDNGQFGTLPHDREWRMADDLPDAAVRAIAYEVATTAFANCDDDVTGKAWGSVALYEVLLEGRDAFPGDVNLDGKVDLIDFAILKENFGKDHAQADLDGNGRVDLSDFGQVKDNFGKQYASLQSVPEPSTALLALLGAALLWRSRRALA
jgi:hypothetical protein